MSLQYRSPLIRAVQVVDALKRKPKEYRAQSFFGEYDLWLYVPVYDERLCERCLALARREAFRGTELRGRLQYLEITDEDHIIARVHPNCRCELFRIISVERYFRMLEKIEERPDIVSDPEHNISKEEIEDIVLQLPQRATQGITTIHLSTKAPSSYMTANNITIANPKDKYQKQAILTFTVPHEYAHNLYRNLTDEERAHYHNLIGSRYLPKGEEEEAFTDDFATVFAGRAPYDVPKARREDVINFMKKLKSEQ